MAFGLRIFNESGILQVSDDYFNLALAQKLTITTDTAEAIGTDGTVFLSSKTLNYTGTYPIVAVRAQALSALVYTTKSSDNWSFKLFTAASPGTSIDVYIFDVPPPTPAEQIGLLVRNADQQIVYDSGRKYMKVAAFMDGLKAAISTGTYTYDPMTYNWTGSSERIYATVFSRLPGYIASFPPAGGSTPPAQSLVLGVKTATAGIHLETLTLGAAISPPTTFMGTGAVTIIDVTHY